MTRLVKQTAVVMMGVVLLAIAAGRVLPRGEHLAFSSTRNWQCGIWHLYLLDVNRNLNQLMLTSQSVSLPALPVTWSPDGAQFAYLSGDKRLETYLVDASAGGKPRRLNDDIAENVSSAVWSADGRWLAFIGENDGARDIYLADGAGREIRPLHLEALHVRSFVWSPDSTHLALEASAEEDIYVLNVETGALQNLTATSSRDIRPAWSPDGTQIAFFSSRANDIYGRTRFDLYIVNRSGTNLHRYTDTFPADSAWQIQWSSAGQMLAMGSIAWSGGADIYIVDVPNRVIRNITDDNARAASPVWSPDGTLLAFESRRDGKWEIYLASADDEPVKRLTFTAGDSRRPAWSPDGMRLLYMSNPANNWDLYAIMLDEDSAVSRITHQRAIDSAPAWRPTNGIVSPQPALMHPSPCM